MKIRITLSIVAVAILLAAAALFASEHWNREVWPEFSWPERTAKLLQTRAEQRAVKPISYEAYLKDHSPFGDYLNYGMGRCDPSPKTIHDANGVVKLKRGDGYYYHPVGSAQCGLKAYGRYLRGDKSALQEAIRYADNLLTLQNKEGAYEYPFPYVYYLTGETLAPGWVSGMAQGQALSLLARVFMATGEPVYLNSGRKALSFLLTPVAHGGVMTTLEDLDPSLSRYIFFEEYISAPSNYTLNGYLFALLGLYDWSRLPSDINARQSLADDYFRKGIETLIPLLPYYDAGSWSSYDLGYITFGAKQPNLSNSYHGVHIYLLNAIYSVTGIPRILMYRNRFISYVEQ